MVREQTLKSVLTLIAKLSDRTINGELLKYLARTANDEQPGIRTNTTICLGKIAKYLGTSSRAKVLIAAFTRSLRDPFVHARNAALLALAVTGDYFSEEDCAGRILPSICPLLIDKEKLIRDQASKTLDVYLQKVRKATASMPDTVLPPQNPAENSGPRMGSPQPNGSSSSASWAGWAISSFTNKLSTAAGEIEPSANSTKKPVPALTSSASALHRQALKSPPPEAPLSRSSSTGNAAESFFPDPDPAADDDGDAWGDMDDADDFFDTPADPAQSPSSSTATLPKRGAATGASSRAVSGASSAAAAASATPFDDGAEPDFAGWLAAQAQKKAGPGGGGRPLPKGLTKAAGPGGGKPVAAASAAKRPGALGAGTARAATARPAPKKIDMKPKETGNDDDGWGDGW